MERNKGQLKSTIRAETEWQRIKDVLSKYENPRKKFFADAETTDCVESIVSRANRTTITSPNATNTAVVDTLKKVLGNTTKHYRVIQKSAAALAVLSIPTQAIVNCRNAGRQQDTAELKNREDDARATADSRDAWRCLAHDCEQALGKLEKRMKQIARASLGRKPSSISRAYKLVQSLVDGRIKKGAVALLCVDLFHPTLVGDDHRLKVESVSQTLYYSNRKTR